MTFATYEASKDDGKPVELLLVQHLTRAWAYTTADSPVVHDGHVYLPLPMDHTAIKQSGEVGKSTITVRLARNSDVANLFRQQPPSSVVTLTLFVKHDGDDDVKAFWKGRIVNCEWLSEWVSLTVENARSSMQRTGLRRVTSSQCPHPLYSIGEGLCNVDKELYRQDLVVSEINGTTITVASATPFADGHFAGGMASWVHSDDGYTEQQMITSSGTVSTVSTVVLVTRPKGLIVGQVVSLYPGCDHTAAVCLNRFNNKPNYGGQEFIPKKNPFAGSVLY